MDIDFVYKMFAIVNFIALVIGRTFWNLTFKKLEQDVTMLKEAERKNAIVRHDFKIVTNSVYDRMDKLEATLIKTIADGYTNVKELFNVEIKNINKRIDEKK